MFKYIILTIVTILLVIPIQAQQITWTKVYGGVENDIACSVKQTPDSGFVVIGSSGGNVWLLKLDQYGDTTWSKVYDSISLNPHDIEVDYDSGYILIGSYDTGIPLQIYVLVTKTDCNGNILWSRNYGITGFCQPYDIEKTSDSGYIIAGRVDIGNAMGFILKLDHQGDSVWTDITSDEMYLSSVIESSDNSYVCGVQCATWISASLLKVDFMGNTIYWLFTEENMVNDLIQILDSSYVFIGNNYLYKSTQDGDTLWSRNIGGWEVESSNDGGFVITGSATEDAYINKFNEDGDSIWTVYYGGSGNDVFYSISRTSDGGYICCGCTDSWGVGGYDYFIVKTDSLGNAVGVGEEYNQQYLEYPDITIENISQGQIRISFVQENDGYIGFNIYDLSGRIIDKPIQGYSTEGEHSFILSDYRSGVYFYCIENSGLKYQGKFQVF